VAIFRTAPVRCPAGVVEVGLYVVDDLPSASTAHAVDRAG
jgi:hypothetical protein